MCLLRVYTSGYIPGLQQAMPRQFPGSGNRVSHTRPALKKFKQYTWEPQSKKHSVYKCVCVDIHRRIESENPHHVRWQCPYIKTMNSVHSPEGTIPSDPSKKNAMAYTCLQLLCIMQPLASSPSEQNGCDNQ